VPKQLGISRVVLSSMELVVSLEYNTIDEVRNPGNPDCCTSLSEPFRISLLFSIRKNNDIARKTFFLQGNLAKVNSI
jgi:hypothetical protein